LQVAVSKDKGREDMKLNAFVVASLLTAASVVSAQGAENRGGPALLSPPGVGLGTSILYAVVNANGTLARQSGVANVVRVAAGNYRVVFRRNVRNCVYVASIGLSGAVGTEINSSIDTAGDNLSVNGVFVDTENFAGTQVDRAFHLLVFCDI
jgi:hypothetical protein